MYSIIVFLFIYLFLEYFRLDMNLYCYTWKKAIVIVFIWAERISTVLKVFWEGKQHLDLEMANNVGLNKWIAAFYHASLS